MNTPKLWLIVLAVAGLSGCDQKPPADDNVATLTLSATPPAAAAVPADAGPGLYRPIDGSVVFCANAALLHQAREMLASADKTTPQNAGEQELLDHQTDSAMNEGDCTIAVSTDPITVDRFEDVRWAGSPFADGPQAGVEGEAAAHMRLSSGADYTFYVDRADLTPATPPTPEN